MTDEPDDTGRRRFLRYALSAGALGVTLSLPTSLFSAEARRDGQKKRFPLHRTPPSSAPAPVKPSPPPPPPRLLMIDPGHGGRDPGAIGKNGTYEKDVTLDIARRMAQHIARIQGLQAKLTRENDAFIPLADRVDIGRTAKADFFVSIHADSAPSRSARGLSAYTLSDKATDAFSKALAQQENRADRIGGVNLGQTDENVAAILVDLATRHARDVAQRAKVDLVQGIGKEWRLLDNPLRAANFAVLRAPDVPSILVETGFLSNPQDEALLRQPAQREKIARLLARQLAGVLQTAG